jgi:putative redox protein
MSLIEVGYLGGECYEIEVRGHRIQVDQPADAGGEDLGPTPVEMFVASLAGCVAYYAGRYLARHGFDRKGLVVRAGYTMAGDRPARVAAIRVAVHPPDGFPAERVAALTAVAKRCTLHNSLEQPPDLVVRVN